MSKTNNIINENINKYNNNESDKNKMNLNVSYEENKGKTFKNK